MPNTREEAWELLKEYNQEPFHLQHGLTVEGCLRYFARELGYGEEEDFWGLVGLLHDLDFEKYPEQHCRKEAEILKEKGWDVPTTWDEMWELGDKAAAEWTYLFTYPTTGYFDAFFYALM